MNLIKDLHAPTFDLSQSVYNKCTSKKLVSKILSYKTKLQKITRICFCVEKNIYNSKQCILLLLKTESFATKDLIYAITKLSQTSVVRNRTSLWTLPPREYWPFTSEVIWLSSLLPTSSPLWASYLS